MLAGSPYQLSITALTPPLCHNFVVLLQNHRNIFNTYLLPQHMFVNWSSVTFQGIKGSPGAYGASGDKGRKGIKGTTSN